MYERFLRVPASVPEEWRQLFDTGHLTALPIIPTDDSGVRRETGSEKRETEPTAAPATTSSACPPAPAPPPPPPAPTPPPPPAAPPSACACPTPPTPLTCPPSAAARHRAPPSP